MKPLPKTPCDVAQSMPKIVRQSRGIANGVQGSYADALTTVPCPRSIGFDHGNAVDHGELDQPSPSELFHR